jgi:hypothetical protein
VTLTINNIPTTMFVGLAVKLLLGVKYVMLRENGSVVEVVTLVIITSLMVTEVARLVVRQLKGVQLVCLMKVVW